MDFCKTANMAAEEKNKYLVIDLHSFPTIDYFKMLVSYDIFKFEQYEYFRKGSYTNRYYIAGPHGRLLLSIPLLHGHRERTPLKELRICNRDRWQALHWKTLVSCYRRSPWFEFYEDDLRMLYEKKFDYLLEWNLSAFRLVAAWLGQPWTWSLTDEYRDDYPAAEGVIDGRGRFRPRSAGEQASLQRGAYRQVFEERIGFQAGLSILDLLFCEGKRAKDLLVGSGGEATGGAGPG